MDKVYESVSNIITDTAGGVLTIWGLFLYYMTKFTTKGLRWTGSKIAEGANKDFVKKITPIIREELEQELLEIKAEIKIINKALTEYKNVKHNIETENKSLKQAISLSDPELIDKLKEIIANEKK